MKKADIPYYLMLVMALILFAIVFSMSVSKDNKLKTTPEPTVSKEPTPTIYISPEPTDTPSPEPTSEPTPSPTAVPTQAPTEKPKNYVQVRTTAYCPCESCSGPHGACTATGKRAQANHTVAVDPKVFPYGTKFKYNGITYVAEDCGGGVKGKHIDIFFETHQEAMNWGSRTITVEIL